MSVLGNTKSDRHRKAHWVESDGPAREFMHLTRGDLPVERRAEVSRGHSSDEGCESGWSEGLKAQRDRLTAGLRKPFRESPDRPSTRTAADGEPTGGFRLANRSEAAEDGPGGRL